MRPWSGWPVLTFGKRPKLNTLDNTDTETISAFRFRLYWLFICLCFTRRGWLCDSPPKQPRVAFGCHTCSLSYFTLVCLWCGRTGGRAFGQVITKISRMGRLPHFLRHGATGGVPLLCFQNKSAQISKVLSLQSVTENMIFNHFFIFSWLKIGYKQNSETKVSGKSLFQFWFAIRNPCSPFSVVPAFVWLIDLLHAPLTSSNFYNIFIVGLVFILWNGLLYIQSIE